MFLFSWPFVLAREQIDWDAADIEDDTLNMFNPDQCEVTPLEVRCPFLPTQTISFVVVRLIVRLCLRKTEDKEENPCLTQFSLRTGISCRLTFTHCFVLQTFVDPSLTAYEAETQKMMSSRCKDDAASPEETPASATQILDVISAFRDAPHTDKYVPQSCEKCVTLHSWHFLDDLRKMGVWGRNWAT